MPLSRRTLLLSLAAPAVPALAGGDRWHETLSFLEAEQAAGTMPGAVLVAAQGRKVLLEHARGTYCSLRRRDEPLHPGVLHPLYSFSKLVSATVVMQAVQDGVAELDVPVSGYLPEFAGGGKDQITLRHLLTHAAGIPAAPIGPVKTEAAWRQAWSAACAAKTDWEPGSRTAYHGLSGLFVAAEVIRRRSGGKSWEAICRERLFRPLGARSLTFELPGEDQPVAVTPQPPAGQDLPKTLDAAFPHAGQPAGGCFGTAADAMKVLRLHLNGGVWRGKRLLAEAGLQEMHRIHYGPQIRDARAAGRPPVHEPWGLGMLVRGEGPPMGGHGWFGLRDQGGPRVFGHAGIDTVIGVADPDTGRAVVFISTASPPTSERTVALRNGVVTRVFRELGSA